MYFRFIRYFILYTILGMFLYSFKRTCMAGLYSRDPLFNETRILCLILTSPENHVARAFHVKKTWGIRCNKLLFMSTGSDRSLGTVKLSVDEGRDNLWEKTRKAFLYVYDNHFNDAEWFLKADDDTYVIMENLRKFLYPLSSNAPVYFGCKFNPFVQQGYMSGGAGYVLSKEAVRLFAANANKNSFCLHSQNAEDLQMGACLQNVGIIAGDSRDEENLERFLPLNYKSLIPKISSTWYEHFLFYKPRKNVSCCSRSAISFHYIKPGEFYVLEYWIYGLNPIINGKDLLPPKANMTALINKWKKDTTNNMISDDMLNILSIKN